MVGKLVKSEYHIYILEDNEGNLIGSISDNGSIYKLSLKNCESIVNGYDLDKLARQEAEKLYDKSKHEDYGVWEYLVSGEVDSIKIGFQKCLELMCDKKFSEDDIHHTIDISVQWALRTKGVGETYQEMSERILKSLQQTEFDVEIEMEPYHDGNFENDGETHSFEPKWRPILDNDGCLILKRIQTTDESTARFS